MIICIAGASGSGKTTLAQSLHGLFGVDDVRILQQDCYYLCQSALAEGARKAVNYDHPSSIDYSLLREHVRRLSLNLPVEKPDYDFVNHTRSNSGTTVYPSTHLIVEGTLVLNDPELREMCDLRMFVQCDLDVCLMRRVERDIRSRGRSVTDIFRQYRETVKPMLHKFVLPQEGFANYTVNTSTIPLASSLRELECLLRLHPSFNHEHS